MFRRLAVSAACFLLPLAPQMAVACPVCYGDLEPEQSRGFFWGILFLIALPPALILYIAGHVIHNSKKKARADFLIDRAQSIVQKSLTN